MYYLVGIALLGTELLFASHFQRNCVIPLLQRRTTFQQVLTLPEGASLSNPQYRALEKIERLLRIHAVDYLNQQTDVYLKELFGTLRKRQSFFGTQAKIWYERGYDVASKTWRSAFCETQFWLYSRRTFVDTLALLDLLKGVYFQRPDWFEALDSVVSAENFSKETVEILGVYLALGGEENVELSTVTLPHPNGSRSQDYVALVWDTHMTAEDLRVFLPQSLLGSIDQILTRPTKLMVAPLYNIHSGYVGRPPVLFLGEGGSEGLLFGTLEENVFTELELRHPGTTPSAGEGELLVLRF